MEMEAPLKRMSEGAWRGRANDASYDRASGNQLVGLIPFCSDALGTAGELSEAPGMPAGCPSHARLKGLAPKEARAILNFVW